MIKMSINKYILNLQTSKYEISCNSDINEYPGNKISLLIAFEMSQ